MMSTMALPISPQLNTYWRAEPTAIQSVINGIGMKLVNWRFHKRVDTENMLLVPRNDLHAMPMSFHACLVASSTLLTQIHQRPRVAEGDMDFRVDPRAIVQNTAMRYNVDPTEMMTHYPACRVWLGHRQLILPMSIKEGFDKLRSVEANASSLSIGDYT